MLRIWFILVLGSFAVSVLTLAYVQTRVLKKRGWNALGTQVTARTYWANLSPAERVLLWLGFVAFFITIVSATGLKVVTLFGPAVIDTMSKPSNLPLEPTGKISGK